MRKIGTVSLSRTVGIIGCGVMGSAIAGFLPGEKLVGFDNNREKVEALGISVADSVEALVDAVDCVLLAIKPQNFREMKVDFKDKLVVSIMAGVKLADLPARVVRVMPNLGARVGKSVNAFICGDVSADDKILVKNLLEKFGVAIEVKSDDEIDKMTALFGCGPAYLYLFLDALMEKGLEFGFDEKLLDKALPVFVDGAMGALQGLSPKEAISKVESKGGTTEVALKVLNDAAWKDVLKKAAEAAFRRAKEL